MRELNDRKIGIGFPLPPLPLAVLGNNLGARDKNQPADIVGIKKV